MRSYKDIRMQAMYDALVNMSGPKYLRSKRIGGAILDAFTCGWNGIPLPPRFSDKTPAYAAYYAGVDAKKRRSAVSASTGGDK